jgi:hypothetical protein
MLAYVFWHRPYSHIDGKLYEQSIVRFQSDLARQAPPGFMAGKHAACGACVCPR